MIRFEGVTFVMEWCLAMSRADFISLHLPVFWQDRDKATRRKMLGQAYDLMAQKRKGEQPPEEEREERE